MKRIIIDVQYNNTKVCITEDGKLIEFWIERQNLTRLVGNIYKGKVENVLQGMQAAFVNIGLERNGFLYAGDSLVFKEELKDNLPDKINLKAGDQLLCQVIKDQFGSKGARITTNISLPGRLVVLMPQTDYIGVSRKIVDEEKKQNLLDFVKAHRKDNYGYILRTQAEDCDYDELLEEMQDLQDMWENIKEKALRKKVCSLVNKEESLAIRALRDMLRSDVDVVVVNSSKLFEEFKLAFPRLYARRPELVELEKDNVSLVDKYRLNGQIEALLQKKVVLDNGAYLIIDRTEALTVIDVNTGKYVGDRNLEQTVFETNVVACREIARQLILRNIGGIVIVDFIDMTEQEHIDKLMQELQLHLSKDRTKTSLVDITPLGLVEITRKKKRSMLESVMLQPCPYCNGNGYVMSDEHVISKIKYSINAIFSCSDNKSVLLTVSTSVFNKLITHRLLEIECEKDWWDKRIYVIADPNMHIEKFETEVLYGKVLHLPSNAKLLS